MVNLVLFLQQNHFHSIMMSNFMKWLFTDVVLRILTIFKTREYPPRCIDEDILPRVSSNEPFILWQTIQMQSILWASVRKLLALSHVHKLEV